MFKKISFHVFILLCLFSSLQAEQYVIKLASYINKASLLKQISHLNIDVKKNVVIVKDNNLYKLFSQSFQTKKDSLKLLPHYRKVFSDAYIMIDIYKEIQKEKINIYLALQEESNHTFKTNISIPPINDLMHPLIDKKRILSLHTILQDKTFYLCPQKIHSKSEVILIKASFTKDHVNYQTLLGNVPAMENKYIIQKNRLYIVSNNRISISQYSTIDKMIFDYLLVSRWYKGKKIHQMRYYKNEEAARSYIDSIKLF
jgi:hypothetical protein